MEIQVEKSERLSGFSATVTDRHLQHIYLKFNCKLGQMELQKSVCVHIFVCVNVLAIMDAS